MVELIYQLGATSKDGKGPPAIVLRPSYVIVILYVLFRCNVPSNPPNAPETVILRPQLETCANSLPLLLCTWIHQSPMRCSFILVFLFVPIPSTNANVIFGEENHVFPVFTVSFHFLIAAVLLGVPLMFENLFAAKALVQNVVSRSINANVRASTRTHVFFISTILLILLYEIIASILTCVNSIMALSHILFLDIQAV